MRGLPRPTLAPQPAPPPPPPSTFPAPYSILPAGGFIFFKGDTRQRLYKEPLLFKKKKGSRQKVPGSRRFMRAYVGAGSLFHCMRRLASSVPYRFCHESTYMTYIYIR